MLLILIIYDKVVIGNMTKMPSEVDSPGSMLIDLAEIRNLALTQNDFESAVLLSHVHAWIHWIDQNWEELKDTK